MNEMNFNNQQIDALLSKVSENLGMDKEELKQKLINHDMDSILGGGHNIQKVQILKMMQNPAMMNKFMESDMAKEFFKKYKEGK